MIPEQHAYLEAGQCFKMACALLLHDFVNEILWVQSWSLLIYNQGNYLSSMQLCAQQQIENLNSQNMVGFVKEITFINLSQ